MNRRAISALTASVIALGATLAPARAGLLGSTVTGSFTVPGGGSFNLFDPNNGFVPAGYGNSNTVSPVVGSEAEFGYADQSGDMVTIDLTDTQVTLTAVDVFPVLASTYTLTDAAFTSLVLSMASNTYQEAVTDKLTGDVLKITTARTGPINSTQTNVAVFNLLPKASSVAEPGPLTLLGASIFGLGVLARRRG